MKKNEKVIVIGANHAGTSFVRTILKLKKEIDIVIYERNTNTSYLGCGTALWIGGTVKNYQDLFYSSPKELTEMGAKVNLEHELIALDAENKQVKIKNLKTNEVFFDTYDKLVYSGGTWPIIPKFKGIELENIMLAKLFQHGQELFDKAREPEIQNVTIIGAGYIGVELVEAFHTKGKKVTLIDMSKRVVEKYLSEELSSILEQRMIKDGVQLELGQSVKEFKSKDGKHVSSVITDKNEIQTDLVVLCIGFSPLTNLPGFEIFEKVSNGAIKVDQFQRTTVDKNIFILGDAAALHHNTIDDFANVALATNAVKTGIVAAFGVLGLNVPFPGVTGTSAISVFGCHYASTGYTFEVAKRLLPNIEVGSYFFSDSDRMEFMGEGHYGKVGFGIVYDKKTLRILGAEVGSWDKWNHTEVMYAMSLAIQKHMTLPEIALMDVYFLPHFNKPFNFILSTILEVLGINI